MEKPAIFILASFIPAFCAASGYVSAELEDVIDGFEAMYLVKR